ncbi:MAG: ankyrin repeat domain-containing protein, partial [Rickettsiales bacterium]|nr:ankyrin repeat domain-containing protein [Rickettsiales bacterium]
MTKAYQNILLPEVLGREKLKKIRDSLSKDKKQQLDFKISAIISRYKNNSSKVATALAIAETINEGGEIDGLLTTGLLPSLVPIVFAAKHGWTDLVKFLVDSGADIDNIDFNNGRTALIYAAENGHAETVRVLLELGADIEAIDSYRNTALDYAFSNIIIVLASSTKKYHIKNNLGESVWESILKKINLSRNNARIAYIDRLNKKMAIFLAAIVPEMDRTAGNYNQNNDLRRKIIEQFSAENPNRLNPTNNDNRLNEKDLELIDELTELRKINLDYFTNKENSYKQKEFTAEEAIAKANKRVYDVIKINSD